MAGTAPVPVIPTSGRCLGVSARSPWLSRREDHTRQRKDGCAMAEASGSRHVVIVGGGLFAAQALRRAPVQVTSLDRTEHHLLPPLQIEFGYDYLLLAVRSPLRAVPPRRNHGQPRRLTPRPRACAYRLDGRRLPHPPECDDFQAFRGMKPARARGRTVARRERRPHQPDGAR